MKIYLLHENQVTILSKTMYSYFLMHIKVGIKSNRLDYIP
jgi:hypothetical protein